MLFLASRPTSLALLPPAFHALLQALTFLNKLQPAHPLWLSQGQRLYDKLQPLLPQALGTLASMQVMTGITLLLGLATTKREIAKTFVFWNVILRGMYHSPDATVLRMKLPGSTGCEPQLLDPNRSARPHGNPCMPSHKLQGASQAGVASAGATRRTSCEPGAAAEAGAGRCLSLVHERRLSLRRTDFDGGIGFVTP